MAAAARGPAPHYRHLGVASEASAEEIRGAYRRAALATHPDKGGDSQAFVRVVRAFEVLSDPESRREYDRAWLCTPSLLEDDLCPSAPPSSRKRRASEPLRPPPPEAGATGSARAAVLDRLFAALRGASAEGERRELMALLGAPLRAALLSRFERHAAKPATSAPELRPSAPSTSSSDSESEDAAVTGDMPLALMDDVTPSRQGGRRRGSLNFPGVTRRSFRERCPVYQAFIVPARGFIVRSSPRLSLDEAIEQHITLMGAKKEVSGLSGSLGERLRSAFSRLAPPGTRYSCQVHAQGLIGRKLYSPETTDIDVAIATWQRLYDALSQGWAMLREAWIAAQLEQSGINHGRASRSRSDLEAVLAAWERNDAERRSRFLAREARRAERLREREVEEALKPMRGQLQRAQRVAALAKRYETLVWQEQREEDRRVENLRRARLQWHKRRDLTMEEIMRGPPV